MLTLYGVVPTKYFQLKIFLTKFHKVKISGFMVHVCGDNWTAQGMLQELQATWVIASVANLWSLSSNVWWLWCNMMYDQKDIMLHHSDHTVYIYCLLKLHNNDQSLATGAITQGSLYKSHDYYSDTWVRSDQYKEWEIHWAVCVMLIIAYLNSVPVQDLCYMSTIFERGKSTWLRRKGHCWSWKGDGEVENSCHKWVN